MNKIAKKAIDIAVTPVALTASYASIPVVLLGYLCEATLSPGSGPIDKACHKMEQFNMGEGILDFVDLITEDLEEEKP